MNIKEHFPKLVFRQVKPQQIEGRETVQEFLARGGVIKHYPSDHFGAPVSGKRLTQKEQRDLIRMDGIARSKPQ